MPFQAARNKVALVDTATTPSGQMVGVISSTGATVIDQLAAGATVIFRAGAGEEVVADGVDYAVIDDADVLGLVVPA